MQNKYFTSFLNVKVASRDEKVWLPQSAKLNFTLDNRKMLLEIPSKITKITKGWCEIIFNGNLQLNRHIRTWEVWSKPKRRVRIVLLQ